MELTKKTQKLLDQAKQSLPELQEKLTQLKKIEDEACDVWASAYHNNAENEHELYKVYNNAKQDSAKVQCEIDHIKVLAGDKVYMNEYWYSDIHAYEVLEWTSKTQMKIRELKAIETEQSKHNRRESFEPGGFFGHTDNDVQQWTFESVEDNPIRTVRLSKKGYWHEVGNSNRFHLSDRPTYFYDFNF